MSEERYTELYTPRIDPYAETQKLAETYGVTLAEAATLLHLGLAIGTDKKEASNAIKKSPAAGKRLKALGRVVEGMSVQDWLDMDLRMLKAHKSLDTASDGATGPLAPHLYSPRDVLTESVENGFRMAAEISYAKACTGHPIATLEDLIRTANITERAGYIGRVAVETMHTQALKKLGYDFPYHQAFEQERLVVKQALATSVSRRHVIGALAGLAGIAVMTGGMGAVAGYGFAETSAPDISQEVTADISEARQQLYILDIEMRNILRESHQRHYNDPKQEEFGPLMQVRIDRRELMYEVIDASNARLAANKSQRNWFIYGSALATSALFTSLTVGLCALAPDGNPPSSGSGSNKNSAPVILPYGTC